MRARVDSCARAAAGSAPGFNCDRDRGPTAWRPGRRHPAPPRPQRMSCVVRKPRLAGDRIRPTPAGRLAAASATTRSCGAASSSPRAGPASCRGETRFYLCKAFGHLWCSCWLVRPLQGISQPRGRLPGAVGSHGKQVRAIAPRARLANQRHHLDLVHREHHGTGAAGLDGKSAADASYGAWRLTGVSDDAG